RGRMYRSITYSVDPATGNTAANYLTSDIFYDRRGNTIKSTTPGGPVSKTFYDGAGRIVKTFLTDGGGDSGWADADDVTGDIVLSQTERQYDANGNTIFATTSQRLPTGTGTGELTGSNARISYSAN